MLFKNTYMYLYTFKFRTPQDENSAFHGIGASVSGADRQPFSCHIVSQFLHGRSFLVIVSLEKCFRLKD